MKTEERRRVETEIWALRDRLDNLIESLEDEDVDETVIESLLDAVSLLCTANRAL